MEHVRIELESGVATITVSRPPANAFDLRSSTELGHAVREVSDRTDVGAVIITGGRRIFAAGADLKGLATATQDEAKLQVDALGEACDLIESMPVPCVAAINGYALGGGLEVALACDLRVAANDSTLGLPEIRIGVIPGAGGTQRLVPLIGAARTRDLVYTGRGVDAEEALRIGLVDRVCPPDEVLGTARAIAQGFADGPRAALAAAKQAVATAVRYNGPDGIAAERALFLQLFGTADQIEGMAAFLEKRPPVFGADA